MKTNKKINLKYFMLLPLVFVLAILPFFQISKLNIASASYNENVGYYFEADTEFFESSMSVVPTYTTLVADYYNIDRGSGFQLEDLKRASFKYTFNFESAFISNNLTFVDSTFYNLTRVGNTEFLSGYNYKILSIDTFAKYQRSINAPQTTNTWLRFFQEYDLQFGASTLAGNVLINDFNNYSIIQDSTFLPDFVSSFGINKTYGAEPIQTGLVNGNFVSAFSKGFSFEFRVLYAENDNKTDMFNQLLVDCPINFSLSVQDASYVVGSGDYEQGYDDGYSAGYGVGSSEADALAYDSGYTDGYNDGVSEGELVNAQYYADGYNDGYNDGSATTQINWFGWVQSGFSVLTTIFALTIFPGITLGYVIGIPLVLGLFIWLFSMLTNGGGGRQ